MSANLREQATNPLPMGVPAWLAPRALSCHARQASGGRCVGQRRVSCSHRVAWQPSRRRAQLRVAHRLATPHCGAPCGGGAARISAMALRGPCGSAAWCGVAVSRRGVERKRTREETSVRTIEFRFGVAYEDTVFRQSPCVKRRAWVVQRQPWPIPWTFTFGTCRGVSPNTRGHQVFEPASDPFKGFSRSCPRNLPNR